MILYVFAVRDSAVEAFLPPFFARTKGEAIRSFSDIINDKNHAFSSHPDDMVLYALGTFDDLSGVLNGPDTPERILSGTEAVLAK